MVILHDTERFTLKSYGNGSALLLIRKEGGEHFKAGGEHFMQDDDADQFRNDLEALEHAWPHATADINLAELWDNYALAYGSEP